jgi:hypothetical protein
MLNRFFGKDFHDHFHLVGISAFAVGLPTSKVILSLSSMLLILNLVLEGDLKNYLHRLKSNKLFLAVFIFFLLHAVGLLWTSNFDYALNDIRIKLTLLVIVLVFTVKPFKDPAKHIIPLGLFVATLVLTSLINILSYNGILGHRETLDIRDLSLFGSHIRYGILISIGSGICLYYMKKSRNVAKWFFLPVLIWFAFYTYYSQILSGTIAFIIVLAVFALSIAFERSKRTGLVATAALFVLISIPVWLILQESGDEPTKIDPTTLPVTTRSGNPYKHDLDPETFIDGKPLMANLCEAEIQNEWEKRSSIPYDSLDKKGQGLRTTLIRYMTSKDLRKDSVDFQQLTDEDIKFIENGVANFNETKNGLIARWEGLKFELFHATDPNGHTLRQRLEYWNTAMAIIQKNWVLGVGTGDVQDAFDHEYELANSRLKPENRLRAHNSYLTSWVSFGILGFLSFMLMNLLFLKEHLNMKGFIPLMFILVAMVTFFFEDTLETQTGVSFFAYFYGFFINSPEEN